MDRLIDPVGSHDDRDAVTEALCRLAALLDSKDWSALGDAFTDDATAYGAHGREAIVARCRQQLGGCGPTHHSLGSHVVRTNGQSADATSEVRAVHFGVGAHTGMMWECFGTYHDRLVRIEGIWLVAFREMTVDYAVGDRSILGPG